MIAEISKCPNLLNFLAGHVEGNPCDRIIKDQAVSGGARHAPEPWSGHFRNAPVIFIGLNPRFLPGIDFPSPGDADETLIDFFDGRFDGPDPAIKDGVCPRLPDGGYSEANNYWQSVKFLAEWALDKVVEPGVDYALTEVVHCCSSEGKLAYGTVGRECSARYFRLVMEEARNSKIWFALGTQAQEAIRVHMDFRDVDECSRLKTVEIGGSEKLVVFLNHPSARQPLRTLFPSPAEMRRIRKHVSARC